jgi:peptidoglycan/LPS O-acetylase OafA/YrhL
MTQVDERPAEARQIGSVPAMTNHIPALDGLRGIAILSVMLLHFTNAIAALPGSPTSAARSVFGWGWTGVDLFFVLSGFLITGILLDSKGHPLYFRSFYARRALRIFPLYYAALFLFFVVPRAIPSVPATYSFAWHDQRWFWFYLGNFHPLGPDAKQFIGQFWSLAIEEQFYLVWPLLIWLTPLCQYE